MRKALLLSLLSFCTTYCLKAQQTTLADPGTNFVCMGQSTSIICPYGATDIYTWEVSNNGGNTWTTVNPGSFYSLSTYNYGSVLTITPVDLTLNGNLYRCTVVYQGTNYKPSEPNALYISVTRPATPQFLNPPTSVCAGSTDGFTLSGNYSQDSLYYSTNESFGSGEIGSNSINYYFYSGYSSTDVYVLAVNGCGESTSVPLPVTITPLQNTLAGTAGGASDCSTSEVLAEYGAPGTTYSDASCSPIALINPSGSSPVSGTVTSCVTLASTAPSYNGIAYVPRYYSIEPSANASTSTATVTLYFTQADFDAYNAARGSEPALPTRPDDDAGIANLTISQFHGTGTTPDTYVGTSGAIVPGSGNVVWNSSTSLWSVTFNVTGFSGFFVSGTPIIPLPLTLTNFSGESEAAGNQLNWLTTSEEHTAYFEVQRAIPGTASFEDLGRVTAAGNSSTTRQYTYTDALPSTHPAYSYRLRMVDVDGRYTYSPVVTLQPMVPSLSLVVAPNPFVEPVSFTVGSPAAGTATVVVLNVNGAKLVERSVVLQKGDNALDVAMIAGLPQGVYFLQVTTGTQQQTVKFVKE